MDRNSEYYKQVQLLTSVLPLVARETCFALKGGTAINLFVRDVPGYRWTLTLSICRWITVIRRFLLSFKSLKPDWPLLGLRNVELLPAVRWKMINLGKMDKDRHAQALENLEDILFGDFLHPQAGQQNHRDHSVNAGTLRAVRRP